MDLVSRYTFMAIIRVMLMFEAEIDTAFLVIGKDKTLMAMGTYTVTVRA